MNLQGEEKVLKHLLEYLENPNGSVAKIVRSQIAFAVMGVVLIIVGSYGYKYGVIGHGISFYLYVCGGVFIGMAAYQGQGILQARYMLSHIDKRSVIKRLEELDT